MRHSGVVILAVCSLAAGALAACAHAGGAPNTRFTFGYPDAGPGKVGAKYYAKLVGDCRYENGREARWTITGAQVASGALPPGLTLEDGSITGTPKQAGSYAAEIVLSGTTCAGKATRDHTLTITIEIR
ncbi:MAG TPA: putative Ig domain-containing protein [Kofleriaceae bacterium]|nr:putative Ig domain-containing protein [Kofleriaceae bacterium]